MSCFMYKSMEKCNFSGFLGISAYMNSNDWHLWVEWYYHYTSIKKNCTISTYLHWSVCNARAKHSDCKDSEIEGNKGSQEDFDESS